jgi:hypothetical protein
MIKTIAIAFGMLFLAGQAHAACTVIAGSIAPNTNQTWHNYVNLVDGSETVHNVASNELLEDDYMVPVAMNVSLLQVWILVAPGAGDGWRITVRGNAADLLSCDIVDAELGCTAAGPVAIAAGERLNFKVDAGIGATIPTSALTMHISACLEAQ